jgi:hypothetical protein
MVCPLPHALTVVSFLDSAVKVHIGSISLVDDFKCLFQRTPYTEVKHAYREKNK